MENLAPTTTVNEVSLKRPETSRRVLDPVSRASEILFGLIMVLTFTLSLGAAGAGHDDVRAVLLGTLGCNLAWAIIDAAMYLMAIRGERRLAVSAIQAIRTAESTAGRAIVEEHLPPIILPALTASDVERIRLYLSNLPGDSLVVRFGREDYLAALGVFLLVFLCLFPVAAPFLFFGDIAPALRWSNAVAICMLFITGFAFGRHVGRAFRTGLLMVAVGVVLVAIAMALGG